MAEWIKVEDSLPEPGDYSVLAYFADGGMDMVHVQDYFVPITARIKDGVQQYSYWYLSQRVTHWQPMPEPPDA